MAAIPVGSQNLFDLDLKGVERRILSHEWVRGVHLQKRFPETVSIAVDFRRPRAVFEEKLGRLGYVDSDGRVFGKADPALDFDLPVLSGFSISGVDPGASLPSALAFLDSWEQAQVSQVARLASLSFDPDRGLRAIASYSLSPGSWTRTAVDLGKMDSPKEVDLRLARLNRVIRHLIAHRIAARRILGDAGKKIVVRLARSS
jgi:hypothetical protein